MTLQTTIVPSSIWVLYEHLFPFFIAQGEGKLCKWRWALWRKTVDILHTCYPQIHTLYAHTIQFARSWPSLVGLSLLAVSQTYFNNCSHITCASSFLLSISGHFILTRQVLRREDRTLSTTGTNNTGLSNFRRKTTESGKCCLVFEVKYFLIPLSSCLNFQTVRFDEWRFSGFRNRQTETLPLGASQFHCSEGN